MSSKRSDLFKDSNSMKSREILWTVDSIFFFFKKKSGFGFLPQTLFKNIF